MTTFHIYTDGACSGNPGPGAAAYIIKDSGFLVTKDSKAYRKTTNNRMEILAVVLALTKVRHNARYLGVRKPFNVIVYSDSQLVVNTMNQGWSTRSNEDLWSALKAEILALQNDGCDVRFEKVKGHSDDADNNAVDRLAVDAIRKCCFEVDDEYELACTSKDVRDGKHPDVRILSVHLDFYPERAVKIVMSNSHTAVVTRNVNGGYKLVSPELKECSLVEPVAKRFVGWLYGGDL